MITSIGKTPLALKPKSEKELKRMVDCPKTNRLDSRTCSSRKIKRKTPDMSRPKAFEQSN